ncbi:hypothetical protein, partial [Lapillicoccus sp.]|uniref:hypothetical protein n=1 Tax=Lapillicoccus sp. TaxID=1909287 RepID=UPI0032660BFF
MTEQYKPGDVVNGHRLTDDMRWVPAIDPSALPLEGPTPGRAPSISLSPDAALAPAIQSKPKSSVL